MILMPVAFKTVFKKNKQIEATGNGKGPNKVLTAKASKKKWERAFFRLALQILQTGLIS